jgi:hypothetical protein
VSVGSVKCFDRGREIDDGLWADGRVLANSVRYSGPTREMVDD